MQRTAARVAGKSRPPRPFPDPALRLGAHAAASLAALAPGVPYDGALPQLDADAVQPRVDPQPAGASASLALAMSDAGFERRDDAGPLPRSSGADASSSFGRGDRGSGWRAVTATSPHDWIVRAIDATVSDCVPARTHMPLAVGLFGDTQTGHPILALEFSIDGSHVVALHPTLAALRSRPAATAACSIVNGTLFLMGPDRMFYEVTNMFWQGDEDESSVRQEYAAQGDTYEGITRAQWDRVYPEWTRRCTRTELRKGVLALEAIAAGRGRARHVARALLELRTARRAATSNPFHVSLADAIGLDSSACWGVPLVWSREENLTAMVLDEMYQLAMQTSRDMSVVAMQFPDPADPRAMRAFRKSFTAALREFAAASELCIRMQELEDPRCTKS
jgi:hypothetical protein